MSGPERTSLSAGAAGAGNGAPPEPAPPPDGAGPRAASVAREPLFWLALALALTRFWRLGEWSLWEDEVFTLGDARAVLDAGPGIAPKNPLGYLLFAGLLHGVGPVPAEFDLRIVPALLGALGIAATGLCCAPIFGARRAAAAALIVAASSWHLYWSQNARFYTLAQDFALIGGACALRALVRPRGERILPWSLAALAALMLAASAQPAAALLFPAWVAAALCLPRRGARPALPPLRIPRPWIAVAALVALGLAAWVWPIWRDYYRTKHDPTVLHLVQTSGWYFTPALLAAALFGAFRAWRAGSAADAAVAIACLVAAGLAVANALYVRAAAQYLFVLLPFVALLATWPLSEPRAPPRWKQAWLAVLCLSAVADQAVYFRARNGDRPQWKEAFADVERRSTPGDVVFTNNANVGEFYFAPDSEDLRHPTHVHNLDRYSSSAEQHWARQARRAWFVFNRDRLLEWPRAAHAEFLAMLAGNARRISTFPLEGVRDLDVEVWLRE